jgi:hypothetical protein
MKNAELIALGIAAVAVYILTTAKPKTAVTSADYKQPAGASEIMDSIGNAFTNGWRYFSDGTAIDPAGSYYSNGSMIWSPSK